MGKNGGESMGEYGWWGNGVIFGRWRSWVKYGGNMEEVGKCVGAVKASKRRCGRYVGGVGSVGKCGEVWGMGSRCVEVCLGRGKMCLGRGVERVLRWGKRMWESMGSRCVEVCLGCGKVCLGCGERCGKGGGEGEKGVGVGKGAGSVRKYGE